MPGSGPSVPFSCLVKAGMDLMGFYPDTAESICDKHC